MSKDAPRHKIFKRKAHNVKAWQITKENLRPLADYLGLLSSKTEIYTPDSTQAFGAGDWITLDENDNIEFVMGHLFGLDHEELPGIDIDK